MARSVLILFVLALVATTLGIGGVAGGLAVIAEMLSYVFLAMMFLVLVGSLFTEARA